MDPVLEIKARLPIEELVGKYCQLQKKGRNFICVCPFHNDTHPSFLVSPDKGIAYCFSCQNGGDIFSFYQKVEGVDFRQALKDLGERVGVKVEGIVEPVIKKDEKDRLRSCLRATTQFYQKQLSQNSKATEYIQKRAVPPELIEKFQLGFAPDSFSDTYQFLLKENFSKNDIIVAGLAIQKDLSEGKMYDRFRNRLIFPIHDTHGDVVGFGGRTLGEDDAKYINSSESPLYNKSTILFGLDLAKESIRETKQVIVVEGYFDVIACHRVGVENCVASSGTALTEQHVKIIKRYADKVVLCLDQDPAGRSAAERAFYLCIKEGLAVHAVTLPEKDPDETAAKDSALLAKLLQDGGVPYLDTVVEELRTLPLAHAEGKRQALLRLLPLLDALPLAVEREHYLQVVAGLLGTTVLALQEDIEQMSHAKRIPGAVVTEPQEAPHKKGMFSSTEIALGLFLLYPQHRIVLEELIAPDDGFALSLYQTLKEESVGTLDTLPLSEEDRERASILVLFCEHHGFADWSEGLAIREIRKNCGRANMDLLKRKQQELAKKLIDARLLGKSAEEAQLSQQYQSLLKLAKLATK